MMIPIHFKINSNSSIKIIPILRADKLMLIDSVIQFEFSHYSKIYWRIMSRKLYPMFVFSLPLATWQNCSLLGYCVISC